MKLVAEVVITGIIFGIMGFFAGMIIAELLFNATKALFAL